MKYQSRSCHLTRPAQLRQSQEQVFTPRATEDNSKGSDDDEKEPSALMKAVAL